MREKIRVRTKLDELCVQLTGMARRLGPGARLPPSRTLSQQFGVSRTTLHVALERLEAQNVLRRRHGSGVFVAPELPALLTQRTIALVCHTGFLRPAGHSAFWDILIEQVQARALVKNETCQLHLTDPVASGEMQLQESLQAELRVGSVQGVIGLGVSKATARWIIAQEVPYVSYAGWSPCSVAFDDAMIVRMGVEELARQGCRRLGLWKTLDSPAADQNRRSAHLVQSLFGDALARVGLTMDGELLHYGLNWWPDENIAGEKLPQEQGYDAAMLQFSRPREQWPDGVVIVNDLMTRGALFALNRLGLRAGTDVRLASHANLGSPTLRGHEDELILMEVSPDELVQTLFDQLETLMAGATPDTPTVTLPPRLRVPPARAASAGDARSLSPSVLFLFL